MQNREKKLAYALGGFLGLMAVWSVVKPWYFGPIDREKSQLSLVQAELDKLDDQQLMLLNATRQIADWKAKSLPPDPKPKGRQRPDALNGQRLYQEWLTDLARQCGFRNPEVTPSLTRSIQDVYVTAQVRVRAEATYSQLCQFLAQFEQADLLHRIDTCIVESSNYRGDPLLTVNLLAEGVALTNAPQRNVLFPVTQLAEDLKADATKLQVADADGFPESGRFEIRIDEELISVTLVKGNEWQVSRGRDGTKPVAHAAGVKLDLGLFNPLTDAESESNRHPRFTLLTEQNPFTIPPPKADGFRPYLNVPREQTVYLGNRLAIDARAEGFNPTLGAPKFQLVGEIPPGMQLEPVPTRPYSSLITWQPNEDKQIASYTVSVQVDRDDLAEPLKQSVLVHVRERNAPPVIENPGPQTIYSGQLLELALKATDENPGQKPTFSLGANAPPEAAIDPATGKFTWTPPGVVMDQLVEVDIIATDNGNPAESSTLKLPIQVKADVAFFTRFVGSVTDAGTSEAWLFDRWNKKNLVIQEGEMLEVANISAQLVEVQQEVLLFQRDGEMWELELGQDVRNMKLATQQTSKSN